MLIFHSKSSHGIKLWRKKEEQTVELHRFLGHWLYNIKVWQMNSAFTMVGCSFATLNRCTCSDTVLTAWFQKQYLQHTLFDTYATLGSSKCQTQHQDFEISTLGLLLVFRTRHPLTTQIHFTNWIYRFTTELKTLPALQTNPNITCTAEGACATLYLNCTSFRRGVRTVSLSNFWVKRTYINNCRDLWSALIKTPKMNYFKLRIQYTGYSEQTNEKKTFNCSTHFRAVTRPFRHKAVLWKSTSTFSCPPKAFLHIYVTHLISLHLLTTWNRIHYSCFVCSFWEGFPPLIWARRILLNGIEKLVSPSLLIKATEKVL